MASQKKKLLKSDQFEVVEHEINSKKFIGCEFFDHEGFLVILPYQFDENGILSKIGIVEEDNPFRDGSKSITLITQDIDDEKDFLSLAKKKLKDYFAGDVQDSNRWIYLGEMTTDKTLNIEYTIYGVNVSDLEDIKEDDSTDRLRLISPSEVLLSGDAYISTSFIKLYHHLFEKSFAERSE